MRWHASLLAAAAGCSNILGLSAPQVAKDAAIDAAIDAGPGDFTLQITTINATVPAGGLGFLDVSVTPSSPVVPILVSVPEPPVGVMVDPVMIEPGMTTAQLSMVGSAQLTVGSTLELQVVGSNGAHQHETDALVGVTLVPGTPDATFGSDGTASVDLGGTTLCNQVAIGFDNAMTMFGQVVIGTQGFGATAQLSNTGVVTTSAHDAQGSPDSASFACGALTADGGSVAGGTATDSRTDFVGAAWLARFSNTSSPITAFGDGSGFDFLEPFRNVERVAVTGSGAIVAVPLDVNDQFAIARQTGSGTPDVTFAGGGVVSLDMVGVNGPSLAVDAGGSNYFLAGNIGNNGTIALGPPIAAHVGNTGTIDAAFGSAAAAALAGFGSAAGFPSAIAIAPDGGVYVGGTPNANGGGPAFVVHLTATGALDTSFGSDGIAEAGDFIVAVGIGVQSDGKIVLAALALNSTTKLVRFTPAGVLNLSYGTAGFATAPFANVNSMTLQGDDDAVLCGTIGTAAAVARLVH